MMCVFKDIIKPADYMRVSRSIDRSDKISDINIAFLSSYTSEILDPYIKVELAKNGYYANIYFAPYKQIDQDVLNKESGLYLSNPDIVIVHNKIDDMYKDLLYRFSGYSQDVLDDISMTIINRVASIITNLRDNTDAKIIIIDFADTHSSPNSFLCSSVLRSKSEFIHNLNSKLLLECEKKSSCYVFNYQFFLSTIGLSNWVDPRLSYLADIPFSNYVQMEIGKSISRIVYAAYNPPKKCLVLDLDNTLWGGVIGEEGLSGIQLGETYPGNVYKDFQRVVLGLRDQGVLLAIASKNNVDDAMSVFENHSGCLLSKEDFSAIEINWNDKASNLRSISDYLNIGLDSMVFFDDSDFERQWVKERLKEVAVIEVPSSPTEYINSLVGSGLFDRFIVTKEDENRVNLYAEEKNRKDSFYQSKTVDEFLNGLEMKVTFGCVDSLSIVRFEQLLNKTNQFNLTSRRYSAQEIESIVASNGLAYWLSLEDRFGDSGISGAFIVKKIDKNDWIIDSFLLSCRIIGRRVELAFLNKLIESVKSEGGEILYGEYVETKKNIIVKDFYEDNGFVKCVKDNKKYWSFNTNENIIESPEFIEVIEDLND